MSSERAVEPGQMGELPRRIHKPPVEPPRAILRGEMDAPLEGPAPTPAEALGLQQIAGNRAVSTLLVARRTVQRDARTITVTGMDLDADRPLPPAAKPPSDIDLGFNALDIAHRLIEAIDQSQPKRLDKTDPGYVAGVVRVGRKVNFAVVHEQLSGLTASQVKEVEKRYFEYENRPLQVDLFGQGQGGAPPNLSVEQIMRLRALLAGTRADVGQDPEAAAQNQREADAYELRGILKGSPKGADVARVMTLLRRTPEEAAELERLYDDNWNLRGDLLHLGFATGVRAMMLLSGSKIAADAYAIIQHRLAITEIDNKLSQLDPLNPSTTDLLLSTLNTGLTPGGLAAHKMSIDVLRSSRRTHVDAIEEIVKLTAEEARTEAEEGGQDALGVDDAVRGRVTTVLGDATERVVSGTEAKLLSAIARIDQSEQAAHELRKLDERDQLTTEAMGNAIRNLRRQAEMEAMRLYPEALPDELIEHTRKLSDQWFIHLRSTFDASAGANGRTFDQLLDRGSQADVDFKRTLYMASGQLSPADELVLALRGDRKDLETVKRVLRNKSREQIDELKRQYKIKTINAANTWGASLDEDLLGMFGSAGKAAGTDMLVIEDYLKRPYNAGGSEEVDYIVGRAEREYTYTIKNRGATGWWRDHWGNEARSLLDATLAEVHDKQVQYNTLTQNGTNPSAMRSRQAKLLIRDLHLARATIRGDRAGYEKATAELRATFEAIASFVLQAVLTAVLSPAATALFRGISAAAAATRYGIWLKNTVVSISSTIAANKAVHGNQYTREMLYADLRGGLSGAIGSAAVGKLVDPIAGRLQAHLGKEMAGEFIEGVKTYGGLQATTLLEGQGLATFDEFAQQHFLGKVSDRITHATAKGLERAGYGGPAHDPASRQDEDAPSGQRPRTPGTKTPEPQGKTMVDSDDGRADYEPPPVSMTLPPELDRPAPRGKTPTVTEQPPIKKKGPARCFVAGTLILTEHGLRPIESIATDDLIVATAPVGGIQRLSPVTATMSSTEQPVLRLDLGDDSVTCTDSHPFWVIGHGWVPAGNVRPGMQLQAAEGSDVPVTLVTPLPAPATVYNLTVGGLHTYHVSGQAVLVHNKADVLRELPPAVATAQHELVQRVMTTKDRAARIREQAAAIPENRPEKKELLRRAEDMRERFEQLHDDAYDMETMQDINEALQPAIDEAEGMLGDLQGEINAAWVPAPTNTEQVSIDAYTEAFGNLRAAIDHGNAQAQAAAQAAMDTIEERAVTAHNTPNSPESRLFDHIETTIHQRGMIQAGTTLPVFGQHIPCQAVAAAATLRGLNYRQIEAHLGIPLRAPTSAEPGDTGAVRLVWTFADESEIHLDIPGDNNPSEWQISREPHLGISGPPPNQHIHLSQEGIAVPDRSAASHLPISSDDVLTARRGGDERSIAELDAAKALKEKQSEERRSKKRRR